MEFFTNQSRVQTVTETIGSSSSNNSNSRGVAKRWSSDAHEKTRNSNNVVNRSVNLEGMALVPAAEKSPPKPRKIQSQLKCRRISIAQFRVLRREIPKCRSK